VLGIVIGVGAVIRSCLSAAGQNSRFYQHPEPGLQSYYRSAGSFTFGGVRGGLSQSLTIEDAMLSPENIITFRQWRHLSERYAAGGRQQE
jgi:hypothetical protein